MRPIALIVAALLCVVCSSANARTPHSVVSNIETSECADPVMRPCVGMTSTLSMSSVTRKSRIVQRSERNREFGLLPDFLAIKRTPSSGLRRVMADGAERAANWIKPRAWCGWWMRRRLGVANPAGNLARWWAGYGRPAHGPHVGAIVVWARGPRHGHVGIITGRTADGRWIVKSGNDGHRVRERPRFVADAIAFRWPA